MEKFVLAHYKRLAPQYNMYWRYSPSHITTLSNRIVVALDLNRDDVFVDLGCGTGLYVDEITRQAGPFRVVYCVDPCAELLAQVPDPWRFGLVQATAEEFVQSPPEPFTKLLMKEVVQHVADFERFVEQVYNLLPGGGRVLIIKNVFSDDFPLFAEAKLMDKSQEKTTGMVMSLLEGAGFRVNFESVVLPVVLSKNTYLEMVRGRYLSFLSKISDANLERGVRELDETYPQGNLHFTDNFQFILGIK